jgi:hypothetical protein
MLIPIRSAPTVKGNGRAPATETVANILERERNALIHEWFSRVEKQPDLTHISMTYEDRTGHCTLAAARRDPSLHFGDCGRSRRGASQAGIYGRHGGGRVASLAGQHFHYSPQECEQFGCYRLASRYYYHRRRSRCPIEATNARVQGRECAKSCHRHLAAVGKNCSACVKGP